MTELAASPPPLPEVCQRAHQQVQRLLGTEPANERLRQIQRQTRIALDVISEALDRYSLSELSLSYNGGKDCLVLLILYLAVIHVKGLDKPSTTQPTTNGTSLHTAPLRSLQSVYIQAQFPFPEVEDFVCESEHHYSLSLVRYAKPMKAAFTEYLNDFPAVKAIFVGTRRTDPHGAELTHFDRTDHGWPDFMRIHPVINWHYADIWTFIRHLGIEYCSLYDQGYTSLGGIKDTHPNPALRRGDVPDSAPNAYRPAFELIEDNEERLGRDR